MVFNRNFLEYVCAGRWKLVFIIECLHFWFTYTGNKMFFPQIELTFFVDIRIWSGLPYFMPTDFIANFLVFKAPYVLAALWKVCIWLSIWELPKLCLWNHVLTSSCMLRIEKLITFNTTCMGTFHTNSLVLLHGYLFLVHLHK